MIKRLLVLIGICISQLSFAGQDSMNTAPSTQTAIFAMGCFWCGSSAFRDHDTHKELPGIISVTSGYAGGTAPNPTYESHAGYKEAVKVVFDPSVISYDTLLKIFWHNVDPFDGKGQFCDKGFPYTSAIFYTPEQDSEARASKDGVETELGKPVQTELIPFTTFYDAEEYHQKYEIKNPVRYNVYRWNCGRDARLKQVWAHTQK